MFITRGFLQPAVIYEVDDSTNERKWGGVEVTCMFNPHEYTITKSNSYAEQAENRSDASRLQFQAAGGKELRLSLTFDTYEFGIPVWWTTRKLWQLMEFRTRPDQGQDKKIPPPRVGFEWGGARFVGVISTVSQRFTLFRPDGIPVRAVVDITFREDKDPNLQPQQNPSSAGRQAERVWRVVAGDRLDTIAYQVYGDATKWRVIAVHNRLVDPLRLRAGQQLSIPLD